MWTINVDLLLLAILGATALVFGLISLAVAHICNWKDSEKESATLFTVFGFLVTAIFGTAYGVQQL